MRRSGAWGGEAAKELLLQDHVAAGWGGVPGSSRGGGSDADGESGDSSSGEEASSGREARARPLAFQQPALPVVGGPAQRRGDKGLPGKTKAGAGRRRMSVVALASMFEVEEDSSETRDSSNSQDSDSEESDSGDRFPRLCHARQFSSFTARTPPRSP